MGGSFEPAERDADGTHPAGRHHLFRSHKRVLEGTAMARSLMLLREMMCSKVEPNVITYSAAISACEKGLQWSLAKSLLAQMWCDRVDPNVVTYSAAMGACSKAQQWAEALALTDQMRRVSIQADVITYSTALSACERGRLWEEAVRLLCDMRLSKLEPDSLTYCTAISTCERGQQRAVAAALLQEMRSLQLQPAVGTCQTIPEANLLAHVPPCDMFASFHHRGFVPEHDGQEPDDRQAIGWDGVMDLLEQNRIGQPKLNLSGAGAPCKPLPMNPSGDRMLLDGASGRSTPVVQEYKFEFRRHEVHWQYLSWLEDQYQCAGWCEFTAPLWTHKEVQDSCSVAVSSVFSAKIMYMSSQVVIYTIITMTIVCSILLAVRKRMQQAEQDSM